MMNNFARITNKNKQICQGNIQKFYILNWILYSTNYEFDYNIKIQHKCMYKICWYIHKSLAYMQTYENFARRASMNVVEIAASSFHVCVPSRKVKEIRGMLETKRNSERKVLKNIARVWKYPDICLFDFLGWSYVLSQK